MLAPGSGPAGCELLSHLLTHPFLTLTTQFTFTQDPGARTGARAEVLTFTVSTFPLPAFCVNTVLVGWAFGADSWCSLACRAQAGCFQVAR